MIRKQARIIVDEDKINLAKKFVHDRLGELPETAIILGSGLAAFADGLREATTLNTREIPHYPTSTVEGHPGKWLVGKSDGARVVAMQGRIHGYEGYTHSQIAYPIHLMAELGVRKIIITNAAGAINRFFVPGQFMAIVDHINLTFDNPLWGPNVHKFGPRFPDMYSAYEPEYIRIAIAEGKRLGIPISKGVYWGVKGPSYETAAEIRMGERIGADAVGMSTVPEVITAVYRGMKVLGLSCISNMATGITSQTLSHAEVTEVGRQVQADFARLISAILQRLA